MLVTYQRRGMLTLEQCQERLDHIQRFMQVAQCDVDMSATLTVATQYAITAYDAQYVALAQSLNAPLITEDKKLRQAVPWIAFSMHDFLSKPDQCVVVK